MKNIKKLLGLFVFIFLFMFSATNVSAKTVTATNAEEFKKYILRQEENITEIKLGANITLEEEVSILVEDGLIIDLNGYKLDFGNEATAIAYGIKSTFTNFYNSGTLTFVDSSENKTGIVDNIKMFMMFNFGKDTFAQTSTTNTNDQDYKLVINDGTFKQTSVYEYNGTEYGIFVLGEFSNDAWHDNVKFTFEINDGTFETYNNNELSTNTLFGGIFEFATPNENPKLNIDLKFNNLTFKSKNGQLFKNYNYNLDYKINDIIPNTSTLYIGNKTLNKIMEITDRTISAVGSIPSSVYENTMESYEYIKIDGIKYDLTTSVNGTGGTISDSENNITPNTKKTIIFTPNTGFMIDKVLVNNVETKVTNNKLELTMNEDKNVVVTYKKIPFTITVKDNANATITPNGIVNVNYGDDQEFVISAKSGYKIVKVLVDGQSRELVNDTLTISNITKNLEVEVIVEKIVYSFLEGTNQTYTISKDKELRFRIDAEYGLFFQGGKVYVDGKLVDRNNYTSESGSTIIVLNQNYLDTLKVGEHTFKVEFSDGAETKTKFIVAQLEKEEANPKTSDNILLYVVTGIISLVGLSTIGIYTYRKKQNI